MCECEHAYEKLCDRTGKNMIFCRLKKNSENFQNICINQRFCQKLDKYVQSERITCKDYNKI